MTTQSFGVTTDPDGNPVVRVLPIDFVDALPAAGEFPGHLFWLKTGTVGYYVWDGSTFVGPFGTGGGGGGAPTTAQYVTLALDGTLTSERVLAVAAELGLLDGGANGNVTLSVQNDGITNAKLRNSSGLSVIGRAANSTGDPADIVCGALTDHVLVESGGTLVFAHVGTNTLGANVVTFAKMQAIPTGVVLGRGNAGTGNVEPLTVAGGLETTATPGLQVANDGVTYAKMQNISAASKLLGRGSAGGAGDPEEITLGTNLSMSGTTLNASGSGTTPTGTGFRHVNGGVEDAAAKLVDTADINNDQVTFAKLQNVATDRLIGRDAGGSGDVTEIAVNDGLEFDTLDAIHVAALGITAAKLASNAVETAKIAASAVTLDKLENMAQGRVMARLPAAGTGAPTHVTMSSTAGANRVPIGNASGQFDEQYIAPHTSQGAVFISTSGGAAVSWLNVGTTAALELIVKASGASPSFARFSGTAFAATPVDGQRSWRTDLQSWFVFDATLGEWLGEVIGFPFWTSADRAAAAGYLDFGHASGAVFTNTFGFMAPWRCRVVGISLAMGASGTASVQVFDDGSAAGGTGDTLALSAQTIKKQWGVYSNAIAADSILGVKVISGTVEGAATGMVYVRRAEA